MEKETTFYRFYSEIRGFLSKLISDPIKAEPSKYLKDRNFGKTKLINFLISRGIVERHETIKDQTNSNVKKPTYVVRYKVKKKDFETKVHRIYSKYFEKNLPEKKEKEIDESTSCGGVGGANGMGYDVPLFGGNPISQKRVNENISKDKEHKSRKIYITEKQFNFIQENINEINAGDIDLEEATATFTVGTAGNYTPNGLVLKTSDGKLDPCYRKCKK